MRCALFSVVSLWLAGVGLCRPLCAQEEPPPPEVLPRDVVAVVNGEKIMRDELADELITILGRPALERMIALRLVEQEARKHGVDVSAEDVEERLNLVVDARIKRWMADGGMKSEAELDQYLQRTRGRTLVASKEQTKAELRMLVRAELLADRVLRKTVIVSPEDIQAAYDAKYGTTIRARQIVVRTRGEAEQILAKLKAGADFELIAKESSIDVATRSKGGVMRLLSVGSQLGRAVADVQPGGLSEITRTDDGYHILKVIERHEKKKVKLEEVEAELREEILNKRVEERKPSWQTKLLERAQVKVNL